MILDFSEEIKEVEDKIEETKEKLLNILRSNYDKDYEEIGEIKGEDLLFYGDCCKLESRIHTLKECAEKIKRQNTQPKGSLEDKNGK